MINKKENILQITINTNKLISSKTKIDAQTDCYYKTGTNCVQDYFLLEGSHNHRVHYPS